MGQAKGNIDEIEELIPIEISPAEINLGKAC
jgi:hypothetical protein